MEEMGDAVTAAREEDGNAVAAPRERADDAVTAAMEEMGDAVTAAREEDGNAVTAPREMADDAVSATREESTDAVTAALEAGDDVVTAAGEETGNLQTAATTSVNVEEQMENQQQSPRTLARVTNSDNPYGFEYEFKLAALVALRARRAGYKFELYSNVKAALPCDDLVLRLLSPRSALYLVQLKHSISEGELGMQVFLAEKGDFSIRKYFKFFEKLRLWHGSRDTLGDDERLLTATALEDTRFLIFTSKKSGARGGGGGGGEEEEESVFLALNRSEDAVEDTVEDLTKKLFSTGEGERAAIFGFSNSDKKVWDLFSKEKDRADIYQKEFLPRLKIFSGQQQSNELDAVILQEIKDIFGGQLPDLDAKTFQNDYLDFVRRWVLGKEGHCLTERTPQLQIERQLGAEFRKRARAAAGELAFRDECCAELRAALRNQGTRLRVAARGVPPGLRVAKLRQALDLDFPDCWTYFDDSALSTYSPQALDATRRACKVIVLDCHENSQRLRKIVETPGTREEVLVLCSEGETSKLFADLEIYVDDWSMEQLTDKSQETMIDRKVLFQGDAMPLRDLESTWPDLRQAVDGALLGALARREAAKLGAPIPCPEIDTSYIPRELEHASALDPKVLIALPPGHHLALSGFPQNILEELGRSLNETDVHNDRRWTSLSGNGIENQFWELCSGLQDRNVHWVEYVGGATLDDVILEWRRTSGDPNALVPFMRRATNMCAREPLCVLPVEAAEEATNAAAAVWEAGPGLLVGAPGMGKSSFLRRAAAEARRRTPSRWVVFVEVLAHRELIKNFPAPEYLQRSHAVELLAAAAGVKAEERAARRCLEAALFRSGAVDVFVDGVDEICPSYKDKMLVLLRMLGAIPLTTFWISSRPEVEESLRRELRCGRASLRALSLEEQKQYLQDHWGAAHGVEPSLYSDLANQVVHALTRSLDQMSSARGRVSGALLDVPLHLKMVAEAFSDDALEARRSGRPLYYKAATSHLQLYGFFVEHKRALFCKRHLPNANVDNIPPDVEFNERHQKCAMLILLSNDSYEDVDVDPFKEYAKAKADVLKKEKTGMLSVDGDVVPHFVHFSFVEFFGAQWLLQNAKYGDSNSATLARTVLRSIYTGDTRSLLRDFVDRMPVEGLAPVANSEQTDGAGKWRERLPLHAAILDLDDLDVRKALEAGTALNATDAGGRTALHLAAIRRNFFRVKKLVDAGCDPARRDSLLDWTPLNYLEKAEVWKHADRRAMEAVEALLPDGYPIALKSDVILKMFIYNPGNYPKLVLWCMRHSDGACRYNELLLHAVRQDFPETARALLEGGAAACAERCSEQQTRGAEAECGRGGSATEIDTKEESAHCPTNGDHRAVEQVAFQIVLKDAHLEMLQYFPQHCWNFKDIHKSYSRRGYKPLHYAIIAKNLQAARNLIEQGADVRSRNGDNFSNVLEPLHCAVSDFPWMNNDYHLDAVRFLLDCGADPNCEDDNGNLAMVCAAMTGSKGALEALLDEGGDIHACDRKGRGLLHYARNADIVTLLLERKIDANVTDESGGVALHTAAAMGNADLVESLLPYYNADVTNKEGITPLHFAAGRGYLSVVKLLTNDNLRHRSRPTDVDILDNESRTSLHFVAALPNLVIRTMEGVRNDSDAMKELKKNFNNYAFGREDTLEDIKGVMTYLLAQGSDVHRRDSTGRSSLHWAIEGGSTDLVQMLLINGANPIALNCTDLTDEKQQETINNAFKYMTFTRHLKDIASLLLEKGVNPNLRDTGRSTLLHHVVQWAKIDVVDVMIKYKADPNIKDAKGKTALHLALESGRIDTALLLLENGADAMALDHQQVAPIDFVFQWIYNEKQINVAAMMLQNGAHPNQLDAKGLAPLDYVYKLLLHEHDKPEIRKRITAMLLRNGANPNRLLVTGRTPLHHELMAGNFDMVELLLSHNALINERDEEGKTGLHLALEKGNIKNANTFLALGADPSVLDNLKQTPLNYIFKYMSNFLSDEDDVRNITVQLLQKGADPNRLDADGSAPLHHAAERGTIELVQILLKYEARVDQTDAAGRTAFDLASGRDTLEIAQLLLYNDSEPLTLYQNKRDPLNYLFMSGRWSKCHKEIAVLLLKRGADPNRLDAYERTPLHHAALYGHIEAVELLLKHEARVDLKDAEGLTVVHLALGRGNLKVARELLLRGADPVALDEKLQEPLNYLLRYRSWAHDENMDRLSIATMLLKERANPNRLDSDGWAPLHRAASRGIFELAELLLKHHALVDTQNAEQRTALHLDLINGTLVSNFDISHLLLTHDANPAALDSDGQQPLNYLFKRNIWSKYHEEIAMLLLEKGADSNWKDIEGHTPLHHVAEKGYLEMVEILLKHNALIDERDAEGRTPLHLAIQRCHFKLALKLLEQNADPVELDTQNLQPLYYVFRRNSWPYNEDIKIIEEITGKLLRMKANPNMQDAKGCTPLHYAARIGPLGAVRLLLEHGASAQQKDAKGRTALHFATLGDQLEIAQLLLTRGADPVVLDDRNQEPLNYVFKSRSGINEKEIASLLLEKGTDSNRLDSRGFAPLHHAVGRDDLELVELLLKYNASVNIQDNHEQKPLHYLFMDDEISGINGKEIAALLLGKGANPNCLDAEGFAPLHHAVDRDNLELVELLLKYNASVNIQDNHKEKPLHYLFMDDEISGINGKKIAALLLGMGANPNCLDADGFAPLHQAVRGGNLELVELLLKYEARVDLQDSKERTALELAYVPIWNSYNYLNYLYSDEYPEINERKKIVTCLENAVHRGMDFSNRTKKKISSSYIIIIITIIIIIIIIIIVNLL